MLQKKDRNHKREPFWAEEFNNWKEKNMLEQINSNLDDMEEQIRDPEEGILEITASV